MKPSILLILLLWTAAARASSLLIPMDEAQANHLKAYGMAYAVLKDDGEVDWLLNYRGGSFMMKHTPAIESECRVRGVSYEVISDAAAASVLQQIEEPNVNMSAMKLVKAAKIVVYSPVKISPAEFENTDAVLLVLKYAEIPFEVVYDEEIMNGELIKYDWIHLHHEDFTGQFGRNVSRMTTQDIKAQEDIARKFGFKKVSQLKLAVAKKIREFCAGGRYLFAMCSGAETFDIALAAEGVDIVDSQFDGDGVDPNAQSKLDFDKTFAFGNFTLESGGGYYGMSYSNINVGYERQESNSFFQLFDFSAKWDPIPTMLVQNHQAVIREFMGQTTAFKKSTVKSNALILGQSQTSYRYIYGEVGTGQFAFYGGHDPEGIRGFHRVPTDLNLHPHSPGYRLILNNVLFPSARKKKRKT